MSGRLMREKDAGKGAGTGGMGEVCRGAHKSLYKGSVKTELNNERDKTMADDFDWAERWQFLTSFFFFCLAARVFTLRRSASLPEQVSTSAAELSSFFFPSPSFRTISPGANWGYGDGRVPAVLEKKRNAALEGRTHLKTGPPVCRSVGRSSPVGWDATTQPCQAQSRAARRYPRSTGPAALSPFRWASRLSAGFRLPRLSCDDSFALIGLFEYLIRG